MKKVILLLGLLALLQGCFLSEYTIAKKTISSSGNPRGAHNSQPQSDPSRQVAAEAPSQNSRKLMHQKGGGIDAFTRKK